jgi:hypothetical protein
MSNQLASALNVSRNGLPAFERYIGIDYSGAQTPMSSLKGLRIYMADRTSAPAKVPPPPARANTGRDMASPHG